MVPHNTLVINILQNIFRCVQLNKEMYACLEQLESELRPQYTSSKIEELILSREERKLSDYIIYHPKIHKQV